MINIGVGDRVRITSEGHDWDGWVPVMETVGRVGTVTEIIGGVGTVMKTDNMDVMYVEFDCGQAFYYPRQVLELVKETYDD